MSKANDLALFVVEYLFKHGIFACRHGVVAGKAEYINKKGDSKSRFFHGGIVGGHDIFAWLPPTGRFMGIEIKIGSDRLRPEQIGFHSNVVRMGALSLVVRSEEDFINQVKPILYAISEKKAV